MKSNMSGKRMGRRDFIQSASLGTASLIVPAKISGNMSAVEKNTGTNESPVEKYHDKPPINIKLNIMPVFGQRIHDSAYGGPCRPQPMDQMTPEAERKQFNEGSERYFKTVKENLGDCANLLEPLPVVLYRDYRLNEKGDIIDQGVWEKINSQLPEIDLFLTNYRVQGLETFKIPTALVGNFSGNLDWISYLRNNGVEAHAPYDWDEMRYLVRLLQVRKAMQSTKILVVTDRPGKPPVAVLASGNLDALKEMYGIGHQYIPYKEFFAEMDFISSDPESQKSAKKIQDKLVSGAQGLFMDKANILNDVNFYLTARSVMKRYNCNAFSMECFELCGSHIAADRKITPCLGNILLRDEGYGSCCEGDINALFTAITFMYLTGKSVYMGNTSYIAAENRLSITHDSAGLRMRGYDKPEFPYEIQHFTDKSSGAFGTTLRIDFSKEKEQVVTISRANPFRRRIMLAKGKILSGIGFRQTGCTLGMNVEVPKVRELYHQGADIGNHLVVVYGDYLKEMRDLARLMNYEVLEA
jgi:L-fucose isomerase-like protein